MQQIENNKLNQLKYQTRVSRSLDVSSVDSVYYNLTLVRGGSRKLKPSIWSIFSKIRIKMKNTPQMARDFFY